jgi:pimeloyl-ACP methyl ester carboxylesterase
MKRGYVTTVDGQMHYREDGAGPDTVVLLHQALRSSIEYRLVVPHLRDRARVISVDLMGTATPTRRPSSTTFLRMPHVSTTCCSS